MRSRPPPDCCAASTSCRRTRAWSPARGGSGWANRGSPGAAFLVVLLLCGYLLPLAALPWYPLPAALALLLGVAGRMVAARATGGRVLPDSLFHPASVLVLAYLVVRSYRHPATWKGRPVR